MFNSLYRSRSQAFCLFNHGICRALGRLMLRAPFILCITWISTHVSGERPKYSKYEDAWLAGCSPGWKSRHHNICNDPSQKNGLYSKLWPWKLRTLLKMEEAFRLFAAAIPSAAKLVRFVRLSKARVKGWSGMQMHVASFREVVTSRNSVAVAFCMTLCELCVTLSCHEGGLSFLTDGGACPFELRLGVCTLAVCARIENLETHNAA